MIQFEGLLLNFILGATAWWAARRHFGQLDIGSRFLAAGVLAWSWSILGMQILGSVSLLTRAGIAFWVGLGVLISIGMSRFRPRPLDTSSGFHSAPTDALYSWPAIACLGVLIWVCLEMMLQSLIYPVKVMSDGPIYHLYFAARWWKAGKYFLVAAPFGENAATYFPANGDLWFTWLMIGWGGDRLARIGQAPFLVVAGVASYRICRMLGAGRSSSLIASTWFLTSTALLVFSFEANVDTIFIANDLLAAYFFLRFARGDDGISSLVLGGLAAGGALGTKSVAIVFVPPLILVALAAVLAHSRTPRERAIQILILLVSPLILSGFWPLSTGHASSRR